MCRAIAFVMVCGLCAATGQDSKPDPTDAIRLQAEQENRGLHVSVDVIDSSETSGISEEVHLYLRVKPQKIAGPEGWRYKLADASDCGWVIIWRRSRGEKADVGEDSRIDGFTAQFEHPAGPMPVWCKYRVEFEDGTSAGGFTQTIH